jgi:hypothetical protein
MCRIKIQAIAANQNWWFRSCDRCNCGPVELLKMTMHFVAQAKSALTRVPALGIDLCMPAVLSFDAYASFLFMVGCTL